MNGSKFMWQIIALLFIVIGTILSSVMGRSIWPFSSYSMYSGPPEHFYLYQIWGENSDGQMFRISDSRVLWPFGHGLSFKIQRLIERNKSAEEMKQLLLHFYFRYRYFSKQDIIKGLPTISGLHLMKSSSQKSATSKDELHTVLRIGVPNF